jgi:hypothetical protein
MAEAGSGGVKAVWAPRSWAEEPGGAEELDVDPRELARRIREHRGEGLIDFDEPGAHPGGATSPGTAGQDAGRARYSRG